MSYPGIKSIQVRTGWWFNAIQILYLDGPGEYYGGTDGGDAHFSELEDGEGIIEVSATEHLNVSIYGLDYLRFKTDTGRNINSDTGGGTSNGHNKTWRTDDGYVLGGSHGKSGNYLNTIGLIYWVPSQDIDTDDLVTVNKVLDFTTRQGTLYFLPSTTASLRM